MSNKTKPKRPVAPRLRFPEFRDSGAWEVRPLGNLGKIVTGKTPSTKNEELWNGDILFITPTDISDEKYQLSTQRTIVELKDTKTLPIGSIVYTCIASIGKIAITTQISVTNQQINSVVVNENVNNEFIYYALVNLTPWIKSIPATSTLPIINKTEFSKLRIKIPSFPEQQRIADCLSSLDELIAAHSRKLDALKAHKKGLLQQLFPAEGETVPRLRFPEFRESGAWEVKRLESVCHMQAGQFIAASDISEQYEDGLYPCYGGNGLRGYTRTFTHSGVYPLVGRQGALCGNVKLGEGQFYATEHAVVVTPKDKINVKWLFYDLVNLNLNQYATGQAQPGLSVAVLEKVYTAVPETIQEQQRIADCLSSLDDLIAAQSQKIDALKAHKNGLLQQLFPSPEDV